MRNRLLSDKYRKARGGYSRQIAVSCTHCGQEVLKYQKDGPGILKRLYFDRILSPERLRNPGKNVKDVSNLLCSKCKVILGVPYVYPKEKRNAFRLFVGAVAKKIIKA